MPSKRVVTVERPRTAGEMTTEVVERSAGEFERYALTELQVLVKVEGHKRWQRER